jgi:glycosyltransferase involved in cell wall biosynthesis
VGIPGVAARWLRGKPFVFEVRDLWPEIPRAMGAIRNPAILWAMGVLEWVSYKSAHRLIGLSPGIAEGIRRFAIPAERVAMIPNGCDLDVFAERAAGPRPAGVGPDDLLAVFTGTHGMANGLSAVVDAAAEIDRRGRDDIKLLLVGDGMEKAMLQQRAAELGLRSLVFHDPMPKKQIAALMAQADLGMQILANIPAFYYGTSPNKFFDYIAAGLPVLNNYPGWLAEMIRDAECGFAVPPADPAAFADALERAADDRAALKQMGRNARILAERDFDRSALAAQWVEWVTGVGHI